MQVFYVKFYKHKIRMKHSFSHSIYICIPIKIEIRTFFVQCGGLVYLSKLLAEFSVQLKVKITKYLLEIVISSYKVSIPIYKQRKDTSHFIVPLIFINVIRSTVSTDNQYI